MDSRVACERVDGGEVRFTRDVNDTRRQALIDDADLARVFSNLAGVPGGLAQSPAAVQALESLAAVTSAPPNETARVVLSVEAEAAFHWALERMMASGLELSSDLHDLRDVVEPFESG